MVGSRDAKDWARTERDRPLIGDSLSTPFRGRDGEELDLDGAPERPDYFTHWGSAFKCAAAQLGLPVGDHPDSRPPQQAVPEAVATPIREIYEASALADDLVTIT